MSYEAAREIIQRCTASENSNTDNNQELMVSLDELTVALETDLVQIKKALSHVAQLLETRDES
jgi:ATP:corrinoid adenosyltransferase